MKKREISSKYVTKEHFDKKIDELDQNFGGYMEHIEDRFKLVFEGQQTIIEILDRTIKKYDYILDNHERRIVTLEAK